MAKSEMPGDDADHYAFSCWKFEIESFSQDGTSVAFVDVNDRPTIPLYFVHGENVSPEKLAQRIAQALHLSTMEFLDFRSCNLSAQEVRDGLSGKLGLT